MRGTRHGIDLYNYVKGSVAIGIRFLFCEEKTSAGSSLNALRAPLGGKTGQHITEKIAIVDRCRNYKVWFAPV